MVVTGVAVAAMFGSPAVGGRAAAVGISVAFASVAGMLLVQAMFYVLCSLLTRLTGAEELVVQTSRGGVERSTRLKEMHESGPRESSAQAEGGAEPV